MEFLRKIFGGDGDSGGTDRTGMYFFVRPHGCEEVVRVRIDRNNDLSLSDDGSAYFVHKYVRGAKCRQSVEMDLFFDMNRNFMSSEVQGGNLVDEADWEDWQARQTDDRD